MGVGAMINSFLFVIGLVIVFNQPQYLIFSGAVSSEDESNKNNGKVKHWIVSWNAPFLSKSGYGSEAIATIIGLMEVTKSSRKNLFRWSVAIGQHGDVPDKEYVSTLPPPLMNKLKGGASIQYQILQNQSSIFDPKRCVVICHSEPGAWNVDGGSLYETAPCPPKAKSAWKHVIGRTMFETNNLPSGWERRLNVMDEIWVPTEFQRRVFQNSGLIEKPVKVVRQGIDVNQWNPSNVEPLRWEDIDSFHVCDETSYKFLSVFKWESRKGHDILIPSFWKAFPSLVAASAPSEDYEKACLIIVTSLFHSDIDGIYHDLDFYWKESVSTEELWPGREDYKPPPGIILLSGLPDEDLIRLYRSVDAFVLPSRGEGWGRPYMEAMAMSLPVIATNWSGPTEFVKDDVGYLLPVKKDLVDANLEAFPGHKWADPDEEALVKLMLRLNDRPEEGRMKGKRARSDVVKHWSHEVIAKDVLHNLERVASSFGDHGDENVKKDEL